MISKIYQRNGIRIRVSCICPPIPVRHYDWCAVDDDHYDGAHDSKTKAEVGYGATEEEAIKELLAIREELQ
jgi:hypothetical protein